MPAQKRHANDLTGTMPQVYPVHAACQDIMSLRRDCGHARESRCRLWTHCRPAWRDHRLAARHHAAWRSDGRLAARRLWGHSPERMRRIGVLQAVLKSDSELQRHFGAFKRNLQQQGWSEGPNVTFESAFPGQCLGNVGCFAKSNITRCLDFAPKLLVFSPIP